MSNFWGAASRCSRNNWCVTWRQMIWRQHSHLYLTVRNDDVFRLWFGSLAGHWKTQVLHYFGNFDLLEGDVIACVCMAGEVLYVLKRSISIAQGTMQDVNVAKLPSWWSVVFEQCDDSCIVACRHRDEHEGLCKAQQHCELSKHKFTFISADKGELLQQVDLRALQ